MGIADVKKINAKLRRNNGTTGHQAYSQRLRK